FLYLFSSPLIFRKSSWSKASIASSTLSHILASICPQRSPRVRARYGSPVFLGFTCLVVTTKLEVTTLFSNLGQSERKNSFITVGLVGNPSGTPFLKAVPILPKLKLRQPDFLFLFKFFGAGLFGSSG